MLEHLAGKSFLLESFVTLIINYRLITTPTVSNHFWALYFMSLAIRYDLQCKIYMLIFIQSSYLIQAVAFPLSNNEVTYHVLQKIILLTFGFTTLFLSLSLNYQLRYRSEECV